MFCSKCGNEISENDIFCSNCGQKTEMVNDVVNVDNVTNTSSKHIVAGLSLVAIVLMLVLIGMGVVIYRVAITSTESAYVEDDGDSEKKETDKEQENDLEDTIEEKEEKADNEELEVQIEQLMVCVPADSMSLRSEAGLDANVITDLYAGTMVVWHGYQEDKDNVLFYQVTVEATGQEGFVSANYCVPIEYSYNENELGIVETDTNLYTYDMMMEDIEQLCSIYPDRIDYRWLGDSCDGRGIYEVILGNPNAEYHVMLQASIHGREYMNTQLVMRMIEYYATYYDEGSYNGIMYKDLFDKTAFHIVPMSNPDGVTISQFGEYGLNNSYYRDLLWECYYRDMETLEYKQDSLGDMNWIDYYKNENYERDENIDYISFEDYLTMWKANAQGVDLNKNFEAEWEGINAKTEYAYSDYKGDYPLSEPESQILADLAQEYDYLCYISYHSKGELIYYDVEGNSSHNSVSSNRFATLLEERLKYKPVETTKGYNVSLGGFGDWIQLGLDKPSVTIESGKHPCPLTIEEFPAMWNRHRETWAMIAADVY